MSKTSATGSAETQAPQLASTAQTFWHSDYRKMCDLVKSFRHVHCDSGTAKPAASQAWIDQLAAGLADVFTAEAQAAGTSFSAVRFLKDTQLPQAAASDEIEPGAFDVE